MESSGLASTTQYSTEMSKEATTGPAMTVRPTEEIKEAVTFEVLYKDKLSTPIPFDIDNVLEEVAELSGDDFEFESTTAAILMGRRLFEEPYYENRQEIKDLIIGKLTAFLQAELSSL